jgi:amidohydrolase
MASVETLDIASVTEQIARRMHQNPELSLEEVEASRACCDFLRRVGYQVEQGVADLETAFVAETTIGTGKDLCIALVAEFDALPNVGHGCGHHLIAGGVLEAAARLFQSRPGNGLLKVFGTPAEEVAAGKIRMLEAGLFKGVDAVVTYHPLDGAGVFGRLNGCAILDLAFHGKATHAASTPWDGRSAQDGALLAEHAIAMERQYFRESERLHGIVTEVRGAHNVFPDLAVLRVNCRAPAAQGLERLVDRVRAIADGAAKATATTVDVDVFQLIQPYQGHEGLARLAWKAMVLPEGTEYTFAGSTDLGDISQVVPTVTVTESGWEPTTWHAPELHAAGGEDPAYESMHRAADAMVSITTMLLEGDRSWIENAI